MSSHREAPEISKDPVADSTDLYAFVSAGNTVTLIANYIPLQLPAGGPNFYEFGDDVLYEIHIDNDGDGHADITYGFRFRTTVRNPGIFLYNTGPISSLTDPNWNRVQTYDLTVTSGGYTRMLGSNLPCPPCNIGPLSTPTYASLASAAVKKLTGGITVFAGQRADAFYVDLGAIFDLADLRPFENLHAPLSSLQATNGVNATDNLNVHSIAIRVPISALTVSGRPTIGVWTTASRQKARIYDADQGQYISAGPFVQVSRLGNPLVNEVLIPMGQKDLWNSLPPAGDKHFAGYITNPALAGLLNTLYPGSFTNVAALATAGTERTDLEAILLTGIPAGVISKTFTNYTGSVLADMLRLNTSIAPTAQPSMLGLLGSDPAGFPNGRRPGDDVVTIELRAVAGLTYKYIDPTYTVDPAAGAISDFNSAPALGSPPTGTFPYLGTPYCGYRYAPAS
jgi:hypothetical protein